MKVVNSFLERCAQALEVLSHQKGGLALGEVAARLDIPKSAAHRLLTGLAGIGWVEQEPHTGFYRLTLRLALLGQHIIGSKLPEICQPILDRLGEETHELIRLAVVDSNALVWVAVAQGAQKGIIYQPEAIARVPLHVTANGKAWLANMNNEEAVALVLQEGFGRKGQFGPNAVQTVDALLRELEITRERGWGLAWEETEAGVAAVAMAIRPRGGDVVATMSIAGPIFRITRERIPSLIEILRKHIGEIASIWPNRH